MSDEEEETTETTDTETEGSGIDASESVETPSLTDGPETETPKEGETVEGAAEAVVSAPAADPISTLLAARAARAGIEDDELSQFSSAKELERYISGIERRAPKQKDSAQTQMSEELQFDALFPELPKDVEFDEKFRETWDRNRTATKQLHEYHKQQVAQMQQAFQGVQYERRLERFESGLSKMPEGEKLFGVEDTRSKEQEANCGKLWGAVDTVASGYIKRGERLPSEAKLMTEAHRLAFGETIKKAAVTEVANKLTKKRSQFSIPPTQRNPVAAPDLRQQKLARMAAVRKQKGIAS